MLLFSGKSQQTDSVPHLEHGPSFKKRLGWWIRSGKAETITLDVTPEMAEEMLAYNDRNRPLSGGIVKKYAAEMKAGRWHYTRVPVIFSGERLIDGQHRLAAVVESGVTVRADIAFGAPDNSFYYIDRGKPRTAGHIFAINGVPNASLCAAITLVIYHYDNGTIATGVAQGGSGQLGHDRLYEEFVARPDIMRSLFVGHLFQTNIGLAPSSIMGALHYICAKHNRAQADDFFRKLATGENINRKDAVFALRKKLLAQSASEKLTRIAIAAMTVKAWNNMRAGRVTEQLRWGGNESFPRAR